MHIRTHAIRLFAVSLALSLAAGCSSMKKEKTAKEEGYDRWNRTRSAVKYSLAKQSYASGNFDQARKAIDEALALVPNSADNRILSAKIHIEKGNMESAQKDLEEARKADEKNAEAEYLAGVIHQRWQKPQAALEAYSRAVEKAPNELAYLLAKAEMMIQLDQRDAALALLQERMTFFETSATIRDAIGQLLMQQGRYGEAATILRQATILAPDEKIIREHLALSLYYNKQHREAMPLLERATAELDRLPRKDNEDPRRADLLAALGECQLQNGKFREARDSFDQAAQIDPSLTSVWLGLAKAAMQLNDIKRVELSLRKASSLDSRNAEVMLMQGYLKIKQNKLPEALSSFRRASAINPSDTVALCMSGYVLEKMGRNNDAIACYARALKMKPGDEMAATLMSQARLDQ